MSRPGDGQGEAAGESRGELERAADELAATGAQGQADVETSTGGEGCPAGSDVEGSRAAAEARRAAGGRDRDDVTADDVAPGPDAG